MANINKIWRFIATGFCFSVFGLGGLILTLTWMPVYRIRYRDQLAREKASRKAIHNLFKGFVNLMIFVGVIAVEGRDLEKLSRIKGKIVIANHPCLIDVVLLISYIENANCVVKQGLWNNWFIRGVLQSAGYLSNADPERMLAECKTSLEKGDNLIIFPEGTRTVPGEEPRFQRGAANLAIRTGKNFQLVFIRMSPFGLTKGMPWYKVPESKMKLMVDVRNEFDVTPYLESNVSKSVRGLTRDLQAVFVEELQES